MHLCHTAAVDDDWFYDRPGGRGGPGSGGGGPGSTEGVPRGDNGVQRGGGGCREAAKGSRGGSRHGRGIGGTHVADVGLFLWVFLGNIEFEEAIMLEKEFNEKERDVSNVVGDVQCAFMKGKYTLDGVLIANETMEILAK
ncbi:hypothetical protein Tco_1525769 [Tanacetum coccineum]